MASPAGPGLFFCFAALVLLITATVSSPIWNKISFLDTNVGGTEYHFGVFGWTHSARHLGYPHNPIPTQQPLFNSDVLRHLSVALVLHPIAAALALLATLFGICGAAYHRSGTVLMAISAALATLITLIVWVFDMVLFGVTRHHLREQGYSAQFGNANWITLGAFVSLAIGFCAAVCGVFGPYRSRRGDKY